ncbi:taste receptor type 1 member 1 [Corythoichthys intestinalis]|uniref:taste receptor type 1 member 1 n=1 Tax=Corythoichthys intestinalis TaxID=161448 RepID=UPI0025A54784|nr:taste receptor type 1 member 1 [Corythoichthys intestinalis]XP_061802792.1 taste receptor type 1 member 1-like [Nerophis lumbriciformis]
MHFLPSLYLMGYVLQTWTLNPCNSQFKLNGDYLIGGLFDIHVSSSITHERPEAIHCSSQAFSLSSYRRFQLMRFSVEQINNSSELLPNVSLGYKIFDHCSISKNFPGIFDLISANGSIKPWSEEIQHVSSASKIVGVVGPFTSTDVLTVAPLFVMDLIPLVSYGAASSAFSEKAKYSSFLRTVHSNKDSIKVIVAIMEHFKWQWVAFLNSNDAYGNDGLALFRRMIKETDICLALAIELKQMSNYSDMFHQIEVQRIKTIVVFAPKLLAEALIESAVQLGVKDKVWLAVDTWSLNEKLPKMKDIQKIGTVLGVSQPVLTIPGFSEFVLASQSKSHCDDAEGLQLCNQICNCSSLSVQDIISLDPSYSFSVYSAVYAVAHALHNVLKCEKHTCQGNSSVLPHKVLVELKKSNFTLLNQHIQFDEHGDPKFGSYSIVLWNKSGHIEEIGLYKFESSFNFVIDETKIRWHGNFKVPTSRCSDLCPVGFAKKQDGIHKCCFTCEECPYGTYINITENAYKCVDCKETEWSYEASTSCTLREVEYVSFEDSTAILIIAATVLLLGLGVAVSVIFAFNYNTPVVRSAGGHMCFLSLGCLSLSSLSIIFFFGKPSIFSCILRFVPFSLLFSMCLACFLVRAFQIVCIFKMAAKFPKLHGWWMKYHGQWLVVTGTFVMQCVLNLTSLLIATPIPYNETNWARDKIILSCHISTEAATGPTLLVMCLCTLCFVFSYMGKDLPKNYNEAKAITFCLLLLTLTWMVFVTIWVLYRGKFIQTLNALAVLSSLYAFLLWYFLPKCYIILYQPHKNTPQYFQGIIQNYTKTISQ